MGDCNSYGQKYQPDVVIAGIWHMEIIHCVKNNFGTRNCNKREVQEEERRSQIDQMDIVRNSWSDLLLLIVFIGYLILTLMNCTLQNDAEQWPNFRMYIDSVEQELLHIENGDIEVENIQPVLVAIPSFRIHEISELATCEDSEVPWICDVRVVTTQTVTCHIEDHTPLPCSRIDVTSRELLEQPENSAEGPDTSEHGLDIEQLCLC